MDAEAVHVVTEKEWQDLLRINCFLIRALKDQQKVNRSHREELNAIMKKLEAGK